MVMDDAETALCEACRQPMGQLSDCWERQEPKASNRPTANQRQTDNKQTATHRASNQPTTTNQH